MNPSLRTKAACLRSVEVDGFDADHSQHMRDIRKWARENAADIQAEWDALDGRTTIQKVRDDWAAMSPERRAELNGEWE